MKPFISITGVAVPLLEDDVNTDQIAPVGGGARLSENYAETLFRNRRRRDNGETDPDFVFNRPKFRTAAILVTGRNFGCGSSRESAVWALQAVGIGCIVARSFADIYRENCLLNGILPVALPDAQADLLEAAVLEADGAPVFTADLEEQTISGPQGLKIGFEISASDRTRLLEGLDDIGMTLKHLADLEAFEAARRLDAPWTQKANHSA